MNHMIHIAAISQIRLDTPGRAYYRRKLAAGRRHSKPCAASSGEFWSPSIDSYSQTPRRRMPHPLRRIREGICGATLQSSAADLHPHIDTSDQPLPGPANTTLQPLQRPRKTAGPRTPQTTG